MESVYASKEKCCGCSACENICPQKAISMRRDEEGFLYPVIDKDLCVDCGVCQKVCPNVRETKINKQDESEFFAAYNKDKDIMKESSSGGVFWLLCVWMIQQGGTVYGAELKDDFYIAHGRAENLSECVRFRKSKYLQSDIGDTYKLVKKDLQAGKKVLYSGTPCQIAGLYNFLQNRDITNLYTCDVVCHGVPSRTVFNKYLDYIEKENESKPVSMCWRNKINGWGPNHVSILLEDGRELISSSSENAFQKGFLYNVYLRHSCYECKFARLPRVADMSLADFWGYEGELKQANSNQGLSIVITASDKGKEMFNDIKENLMYETVEEEYVKEKSRHVYIHPQYNPVSRNLYKNIEKLSFEQIERNYINPDIFHKIKNRINRILG